VSEAVLRASLEPAGIEFIDQKGGGPEFGSDRQNLEELIVTLIL
jgi:hypothetical protein